jgi:tetratricopeptide (TPR) repeat protein
MRLAVYLGLDTERREFSQAQLKPLRGNLELSFCSARSELVKYLSDKKIDIFIFDTTGLVPEEITSILSWFRQTSSRAASVLGMFAELNPQALAIATDYNLAKVISVKNLKEKLQPCISGILTDLSRPSSLRSYLLRIDAAIDAKTIPELDKLADEFYKLHPDNSRACVEFAAMKLRAGLVDEALEITEKTLKIYPENMRLINIAARCLLLKEKHNEALVILDKAEILSPKNLDRLVVYGDVFRLLGDNTTARECYEEALERDPQLFEARKGLGAVELSEGEVEKALQIFQDCASEEEIGSFFNNTAVLAVKKKQFEKALHLYVSAQQVLTSANLKAKVSFNSGLAYKKWLKYELAGQCFLESLSLDSGFIKAYRAFQSLPEAAAKKAHELLQAKQGSFNLPPKILALGKPESKALSWENSEIVTKDVKQKTVSSYSPTILKSNVNEKHIDEEEDF